MREPAFTNCGTGQHLDCLNSRRWSNAAYESALDSAFVVDRKPDGLLFGMRPRNSMPAMRLDQHVVAGTHVVQRRVLFELEHGRARQQYNPFGAPVVVPEPFGTRVSHGYDPLHVQALPRDEHVDALFTAALRFEAEQVTRLKLHGSTSRQLSLHTRQPVDHPRVHLADPRMDTHCPFIPP